MAFYQNKILFIIFVLSIFQNQAQNRWIDRNAEISFDAKVPSFEPVAAKTQSATAVFEPESGKIAGLVFVNTFNFKVALMQEHFNESYAETDTYPKATFEGQVLNFDKNKPEGTYNVKGNLTIKDVSKPIEIQAEFKRQDKALVFTSDFEVDPQDYNF